MSIALDGFEVFQKLGEHAEVFAPIRADIDKQARALVVKCLKAKAVGPTALCNIRKALGKEQFELLIEGLKDAEVKSVLTRIDKHHPEIKNASVTWRRQHLGALADGSSTPHLPVAKAKKASKKKAEPARLHSEVVDVYANKKSGKRFD
jgi:hypothetical protein